MKDPVPARVVLSDANVLYSRVLRDYLLYAATRQLISIAWSQSILDEMTEISRRTSTGSLLTRARCLSGS